jgi:transaldolase
MLRQALELAALAPNIMIKAPGTSEGIEVLHELTALGIPTNATLAFVLPQFVEVAEAVQSGLLKARANGVDLTRWRSVVTMMSARWENAPEFVSEAKEAGVVLSAEDRRWAGVALFKKACRVFRERAYPSKMLICSLRLGPTVDGVERVGDLEHAAGGDAVFTCPPNFLTELMTQAEHVQFSARIDEPIPEDVMGRLRQVPYFARSYAVDGLTRSEFKTVPALVSTFHEFCRATEKMVAFVQENMRVEALRHAATA